MGNVSIRARILNRNVDIHDDGHKHWMKQLAGVKKEDVETYFRKVAITHNNKYFPLKIEDFLDDDDEGERILYILPNSESDVFMATSLLKSIKNKYPDNNIYFCTEKRIFLF